MAFYRKYLCFLSSFIFATLLCAQEQQAVPELPAIEPIAPREDIPKETPIEAEPNSSAVSSGFARYFNAVDFSGSYMRTRLMYGRNLHLRTYIPESKYGTSNFPPKLSAYEDNDATSNPDQNIYSANMRLRLNPTINISELTRVKATFDIFDNLVLGSTPSYMMSPVSFMSRSQVNTLENAFAVKRAWGEANFPIGELRFGRMPMHWGLGILHNSGDGINSDFGDQIDGVAFTTRIFDHFVTPAYSIAYTGKLGRGAHDSAATRLRFDAAGQKYPLESSDIAHVISLSILKRDSEFITDIKKSEGKALFNYGLFASYRTQDIDTQDTKANTKLFTKRNGHVGMGSLWAAFSYKTFHIEAEFAGIWGKYRIKKPDSEDHDLGLLQGGFALESKYGFLNDRLQVGLDAGLASAQDGPGFAIHETNDDQKLPKDSLHKTSFKFNPAYNVDLLLYREVLGGISGTYYFRPHISYFFSRNFGVRGDALSAFALKPSNTKGNSSLLGIELDASTFLRTENGFYCSLAYGVLFPLKGLNHRQGPGGISENQHKIYGEAHVAHTVQLYLGLLF